ncbi:hypothetical protein [Streptosporangium sp. NPDC002721]
MDSTVVVGAGPDVPDAVAEAAAGPGYRDLLTVAPVVPALLTDAPAPV